MCHLLAVEFIGFDQQLTIVQQTCFLQVIEDIHEQGSMDVGLPCQKPIGGKRQLTFGGRFPSHLFVQFEQTLVGQFGFAFEHLQACTQANQLHSAIDLTRLVQHAAFSHLNPLFVHKDCAT